MGPILTRGTVGIRDVTYLFIDGAYLRERYQDAVRPWFGSGGEIDLSAICRRYDARKTFYYDCLDTIERKDETEATFKLRVSSQEAYFNRIRELAGFHVQLGTLSGDEKRRRQKEVDVLLAVDMMNHAIRGNMTRAVLLAGDRDFKPVVDSLIQIGTYVHAVSDPRSTSEDLVWAADESSKITFQDYFQWSVESLRVGYPIPAVAANVPPAPGFALVKAGSTGGLPLYLYRTNGHFVIYLPKSEDGYSLRLIFEDQERLELYFQLQYGDILWNE